MKIDFTNLSSQQIKLREKIDKQINNVLNHGKYIMGPEVYKLENNLSKFCGSKFSITCANGTDALILSLMSLDVVKGDVVFCPSFTFAATAEAIAFLGATPFFIDVDSKTFNIDVESLERSIKHAVKTGLRIKGIITVDLFGLPANYDEITKVSRLHNLWILSDSAQSFGSSYKGKKIGTITDITTTSFFPSKPLGCYGDGGAIFTSKAKYAKKLLSLRAHGKGKDKYNNERIGLNSRLDTIQAAILIEKLKIFEKEILNRQKIAQKYSKELCDYINIPKVNENSTHVWAQYTISLSQKKRSDLIKYLYNEGIPTIIYYPIPLHKQKAYKSYPKDPIGNPVSERLSKTVLSLPMSSYLKKDKQEFIIKTLKNFIKKYN